MFGTELPEKYKDKSYKGTQDASMHKGLNNNIAMIQDYPVDNVWISVVNIGKYPIRHLVVYGEYYFPYVRQGENIDVILTLERYPRKTNLYNSLDGIEKINDSVSAVKIIDVRNEK